MKAVALYFLLLALLISGIGFFVSLWAHVQHTRTGRIPTWFRPFERQLRIGLLFAAIGIIASSLAGV